jgi:hypothetical protein
MKSMAQRIRETVQEHPDWTPKQVAAECGTTRNRVYQVMHYVKKAGERKMLKLKRKMMMLKPVQAQVVSTKADTDANVRQVGGGHYKDKAIQPWDYIASNKLGYLEGNIIKYVSRWQDKGGIEDLRKARHYLDKLIEVNL